MQSVLPRSIVKVAFLVCCGLCVGCVVVAPTPSASNPEVMDHKQTVEQLSLVAMRIGELVEQAEDSDQMQRLQTAHSLALQAKTSDPFTQKLVLDYLTRLVSIEEHALAMEAPILFQEEGAASFQSPIHPIEEEDLSEELAPEALTEVEVTTPVAEPLAVPVAPTVTDAPEEPPAPTPDAEPDSTETIAQAAPPGAAPATPPNTNLSTSDHAEVTRYGQALVTLALHEPDLVTRALLLDHAVMSLEDLAGQTAFPDPALIDDLNHIRELLDITAP